MVILNKFRPDFVVADGHENIHGGLRGRAHYHGIRNVVEPVMDMAGVWLLSAPRRLKRKVRDYHLHLYEPAVPLDLCPILRLDNLDHARRGWNTRHTGRAGEKSARHDHETEDAHYSETRP